MNDEQIARAFVQQMRHSPVFGTAVAALVAIIGEARSTERARCVANLERLREDRRVLLRACETQERYIQAWPEWTNNEISWDRLSAIETAATAAHLLALAQVRG